MMKIENLSFQYKKNRPLFHQLSFEVENGNIVGLLGKNGAGKSTLLHLIAGLIPPVKGNIFVNGFEPVKRQASFLNDVCLVPEEFGFPSVSIDLYVRATAPLYPSFDQQKLEKNLEEFELNKWEKLNQLSHGQRKKFLIAFTLATNCRLLILDEPTNGLDIPSKSQFRKILVSSIDENQLVLISTHQVKDIDTILDRIVMIDEGRMLFNQDMTSINQQWYFDTVSSLEEAPDRLYHENCPVGYKVIRPVTGEKESPLDLELLFNAVINRAVNLS